MKKILLSLSAIAIVGVIAVSATTALFSDTETSTGNTISAGTLDLKVDDNDLSGSALITVANAVPGGSDFVTGNVSNAGSIPGTLSLAVTQTSNDDISSNEPEAASTDTTLGAGEPGELCDAMQVQVEYGTTLVYPFGSLSGISSLSLGTLSAGASETYKLSYQIPDTIGNEIQSDSCGFTITATLTQL